jgi:hypothetical protein
MSDFSIIDNPMIGADLDELTSRALQAMRDYQDGVDREAEGRADAIGAIIAYGLALQEGRKKHGTNDKAFGQWIKDNKLDQDKPFNDRQERAAAQQIADICSDGNNPVSRIVYTSFFLSPYSRPTDIMKWYREYYKTDEEVVPPPPPPPPPTLVVDNSPPKPTLKPTTKQGQAAEVARTIERQTGKPVTKEALAKVANVSEGTAAIALKVVQAERSAGNVSTPTFTKAQDHQVEARVKVQFKKLESEFNERVRLKVLEENKPYLDSLEALQREARRQKELYDNLVNHHKPIFTEAEYRDLLLCTHEGNPSKEVRERAFMTLNAKKLQLIGKK